MAKATLAVSPSGFRSLLYMPCVSILHKSVHVQHCQQTLQRTSLELIKLYTFREFTLMVGKCTLQKYNIFYMLSLSLKKNLTHKETSTLCLP